MSWIGIRDQQTGWFKQPAGGAENQSIQVSGGGNECLFVGSLMVETRVPSEQRPQTLFEFQRTWPQTGKLCLQILPTGGIVLIDSFGSDVRHITLPVEANIRMDTVRLTYTWDVAAKSARLTLEHFEAEQMFHVSLQNPVAISCRDLEEAFAQGNWCKIDEEVEFVALSDKIEAVGPRPGLTSRVPILTADGEVSISDIRRGHLVVTDNNTLVPVLQVIKQTVPALGSFQPIRLRAPYFNLSSDIVLAPNQRLLMKGSQVEYMFGKEAVLVPARHMINDRSAFAAKGRALVTYYHVLLPGHEVIQAAGCPVESLYIGRLRRKPQEFAVSNFSGFDRAKLPEHSKPAWPVIKPFEAVTLAAMRAA